MNQTQKKQFTDFVASNRSLLLFNLKTGQGRPEADREENYRDVADYLGRMGVNTRESDVNDAVVLLRKGLNRHLEVQKPPQANDSARKLAELNAASSEVRALIANVQVRLDVDQLKHQPKSAPIGARIKGGGNRFKDGCDAAWHQANTMVHVADWANGLGSMTEGEQRYHGQAVPVDGIHYEGYCLKAGGHKYVLFHCYPANDSPLRM
jgi:hypothetical protein